MLKKLVGPIDLLLILWRNVGITIWSDEFIMSLRTKLKKVLPSISITEQEALDAGDVWLEGSIYQGKPDFDALRDVPAAKLSAEEQA